MTLVDILPSELPDVARASYDTETGTVGTPDGALFPDDGCRVSDGSVGWHDPETGQPMSAAWRFWDAGGHGGALPRREWDALQDWLVSRQGLVYMNATMDVESNRAGTGLGWPGADLIGNIAWDIGLVAGVLDPGTLVALDAQAKLAYGVSDKATALGPLKKWLMAARREVAKPRHARNRKHRKDGTPEEPSTPEEERFQTWAYYLAPWDLVRPYAATDAELTIRLARRQWQRLREGEGGPKRWEFVENDLRVLRTLIRMERRGLPYDWRRSEQIAAELSLDRDLAYSALPMGDPTPTNLAEWFYQRHGVEIIKETPGGKPSLDKEVIAAFAELDTPGAAQLRTWRTINGAIERWYEPFAAMTNRTDGRLRPRFKQTTVRSGRLSIQRVQLQAIPHNHVLRNTPELAGVPTPRDLIPTHEDGWDRWEMDLAQAELRVAAWMAPAMKMLQIVREGRDPHGELASATFGVKKGDDDWFLYRQVGKRGNFAQPVETPVLTPTGWRPIGDLQVGDRVVGAAGGTRVVGIPYEGNCEVWELRVADGSTIECSEGHRWGVERAGRADRQILRSWQLRERLDQRGRWYLPQLAPVEFDPVGLPVDPYLLGVLLGDGSFGHSTVHWTGLRSDHEIARWIETPDELVPRCYESRPHTLRWSIRGGHTRAGLRSLSLLGVTGHSKFIPEVYQRGTIRDRYRLLAGLLDTDGTITLPRPEVGGVIEFYSGAIRLAEGVCDLVRSLGGVARMRKCGNGHYAVSLRTPECPFRLGRKAERWRPPKSLARRIVSIEPTGRIAAQRCISVEASDSFYVTSGHGVTANSLIFGIGRDRLRADIKTQTGKLLPWEEIDSLRETFNDMHPEFRGAIQSESRKILSNVEQPSVGLCNGRRNGVFPYELDRDFDEATGKPYGPPKGMHKAFNRKVQGSIGEFAKEWMVRADAYLMEQIEDPAHGLLLQNHDALVISVPAGEQGALLAKQVRQIGLDLWVDWFQRPCDEEVDPSGILSVPGDIDLAFWNSK